MSRDDVSRWFERSDMQTLKISPEKLEKWTEEIVQHYSEKWRYYHTLHHLYDMMNHFQKWGKNVADHASVVLAILFHDIEYDPTSLTHESDSVDIFKQFADDVQLNEDLSQKVIQLITATINHFPDELSSQDSDLAFFLDFDMAILGQPQHVYDLYAVNIQREYCHMNPKDFCNGRTKVLQSFLQRPRIYATEELGLVFEEQARQNMEREMEALKNKIDAGE
ncbi:uncharacterized protein [Littorina saxatilis]|uniref:HD domain-containing protein n=1 Tax=Littorina saxatilis TaxID=31220 RepID=A0AAN9B8C5_9CAEN